MTAKLKIYNPADAEGAPGGKRLTRVKTVASALKTRSREEVLLSAGVRVAKTLDKPDLLDRDRAQLTRLVLEIASELEKLDAERATEARSLHVVAEDQPFDAEAI
jgi:hypothetical protein